MEPNLGLKNEDKGDSYRLLNSMKVKTFCEPPGADPQAVVVWGGLEKNQPLPDVRRHGHELMGCKSPVGKPASDWR